jgi:hypothetical protein
MPPRVKSGELPKPVIQSGQMGALPLNPLTVSCLADNYCDSILGFRDTLDTLEFKKRPSVQLQEGKKRRTVSLDGRFFNGFSEALYRGQLPEVILAAPSSEYLGDFLKDFVEYLGKVLSMGFFLPKKYVVKRDPVSDFVPCTVIAGSGVLFSRFMTGLVQALKVLEKDYPVLDESIRLKIVGRFVRGLFGTDEEAHAAEMGLASQPGRVMDKAPVSGCIRIAGGSAQTQAIIQSVACLHGLTVVVENHARNAVERLEFENALWRISTVIVPTLTQQKILTAAEARKITLRIEQGIVMIGQRRQAFEEAEQSEIITGIRSGWAKKLETGSKSIKGTTLNREDAAILSGLGYYAEAMGLDEEKRLFEQLATQIEVHCES